MLSGAADMLLTRSGTKSPVWLRVKKGKTQNTLLVKGKMFPKTGHSHIGYLFIGFSLKWYKSSNCREGSLPISGLYFALLKKNINSYQFNSLSSHSKQPFTNDLQFQHDYIHRQSTSFVLMIILQGSKKYHDLLHIPKNNRLLLARNNHFQWLESLFQYVRKRLAGPLQMTCLTGPCHGSILWPHLTGPIWLSPAFVKSAWESSLKQGARGRVPWHPRKRTRMMSNVCAICFS